MMMEASMIEALAFIATASTVVAVWLALDRRQKPSASDAGKALSARAAAARRAERSRYVAAHIAALEADMARRVAQPKPEFLADAEGRN
jgi:hypothetical protein